MRKLLYVPVIHMEPDLGSAAAAIDSRSSFLFGEEKWAEHKERVAKFWASIADCLAAVDATALKIYQDGLPSGGALSRKIIEEGAKRGSQNYQIILSLMNKGAEVRKTEDASLLEEEYRYIKGVTRSRSAAEKKIASAKYQLRKNQLTEERDKFIARTVAETLKEEETGVLFLGSYHNILPYLPNNIVVKQIKDREKISAYFAGFIRGEEGEEFWQLAEYLVSPCES